MKKIFAPLLVFLAALLAPAIAFAAQVASDTDVQILPPELFQAGSIAAVAAAVGAAVLQIVERFMGPFGFAAKLARLDQIVAGYLRGGLAALIAKNPELAVKGLSVDVGNQFIAQIAKDVIRVAPGWLIRFAGGASEIEAKIRNRLPEVLRDLKLPIFPGQNPA